MRASDRYFPPVYRGASVLAGLLVAGALASWAQGPAQPAGEVVADVIVTGNVLVPTQQIMSQLKTRPGQPYKEEMVRDDVRTLAASKQFGDVRADLKRDADGLKVIFRIQDYPNTVKKIQFL